MEFVLPALGVILIIAAIVLVIALVRFLFTNYLISRVLSLVSGVVSVIFAFPAMTSIANDGSADGSIWVCVIATVLQWCFYIGPVIFDVQWDGSWSITETYSGYEVSPRMTGGFFANVLGALLIFGIGYAIFAPEFPPILLVVPIGLGILNVVSFLRWR